MIIRIKRQADSSSESYCQEFVYDGEKHVTVVNVIEWLNIRLSSAGLAEIAYDNSCQHGLCGACAMVVCSRPVLACRTFIDELGTDTVEIRPLGKFPVISDLLVDRSEMHEAMKRAELWTEKTTGTSVSATRNNSALCLMCGLCLEACPNYAPGDIFKGMPEAMASLNLIPKTCRGEHRDAMEKNYRKQVFAGCTKSMACEKVCPMNLPLVTMMSDANRLSVWKIWKLIGGDRL